MQSDVERERERESERDRAKRQREGERERDRATNLRKHYRRMQNLPEPCPSRVTDIGYRAEASSLRTWFLCRV